MNRQTKIALCWAFLASVLTASAAAQGPIPRPKFGTWNPPATQSTGYYGILGEIVRPGVYAAAGREVSLQELVQQAGGFTPHAGPAVRLIRQQRITQGKFFDPNGRDALQSGDIILIDNPRPTAPGSSSIVHIAMLGVANRPVIVPLRPETATLQTLMMALGQSPELARTAQLIMPSRQPLPSSTTAPLPNGTVFILDPRLLVNSRLPEFPQAIPFSTNTAPHTASTAPVINSEMPIPPSAAMASPPITDRVPDHRLPVTSAGRNGGDVEATPLPFTNGGPRPQVNEASLPVPGSRLQPLPSVEVSPPAPKSKASVPTLNPDSEIIPNLDGDLALDDEESESEIAISAPAAFSIWQMLGIVGTVASLVGLAVLSRNMLGSNPAASRKSAADDDIIPASLRKRMAMPAAEPHRPHRRFDVPEPMPSTPIVATRAKPSPISEKAPSPAATSMQEPHDLAELLTMRGPIETESVILPHGLKLRRSPFAATPIYRVDEAAALPGAPHERPMTSTTPQRSLDAIAEEPIPAPHFAASRPVTEQQHSIPSTETMHGGTAIERALHQLQQGKLS